MARKSSKRPPVKRAVTLESLLADCMKMQKAKKYQASLKKAQEINDTFPQSILGWELTANTYGKLNMAGEAVIAMQRALAMCSAPTNEQRFKLIQFQVLAGQALTALEQIKSIASEEPNNINYQVWLSRVFHALGKNREALAANNKAIELDNNHEEALLWRSRILNQLKMPSETLEVLEKLAKISPQRVGVHNHIADLAVREGDYNLAEEHFKKELMLTPNHPAVHSNLIIAGHYNPSYSAEKLLELSKKWDSRFARSLSQARPRTELKMSRKIRIGLLSGGFRMHPVGQMILPALEYIDKESLALCFYSTNQFEDAITLRIKKNASSWKVVEGLSDEELNQEIRKDAVDILIDMNGAGEGSRQLALARQPAPLIVKWVGMLISSTGMSCMDYLLSDSIETPIGADELYSEKIIRLPDDYICYSLPAHIPDVKPLPALTNNFITFGCLNNPAKISPVLIREWSKLLNEVPNSKILLRGIQFEREEFCNRILDSFLQYGVLPDRILLDGGAPHDEFMATYQNIDIALDTWPYSGGLTTCEALAMGVPVVTCMGPTFAGRHSATHLANAGLPELVTDNWDNFRKRAKELAADLPSLAVIRAALRTILKESPVCDGERFAQHFTKAMRGIWQRHCEGKAPEALTFNKEGDAWFADENQPIELVELETEPEPQEAEFEWNLESPITVIDNGALFTRHPKFTEWMQTGNFAVITFDPGSLLTNQADELKQLGEWHHYPHATLGDGKDATLYATLDPELTGTLQPLEEQQTGEQDDPLRVLSTLPISTVPLNAIEGLPGIDLLILDSLNDAIAILENGHTYLANALLLQVKLAFQPTHQRQPNLAEVQHWMARHGFRFYRFNNEQHRSYLPERVPAEKRQATELTSAYATFLPSHERMAALSHKQCMKLAFLLHTVYGSKDMAYALLAQVNEKQAEKYLAEAGLLEIESAVKDSELQYKNYNISSDISLDISGPRVVGLNGRACLNEDVCFNLSGPRSF